MIKKGKSREHDQNVNERKWGLLISISGENNYFYMCAVGFRSDTHQEALIRALKYLQKSAIHAHPERLFDVTLRPREPRCDEKTIGEDECYRLPHRYSRPSAILSISNPAKVFVYGNSHKALIELTR